jgi:hypothetical protein
VKPFRLDGPAGSLEAVIELPQATPPRLAAVLAHPHPLYGGNMDNLVVRRVAERLRRAGAAVVLRFNFRGVGASAGRHDQGRGEAGDLAAAANALAAEYPSLPLWLAGYSFGAALVLQRLGSAAPREPRAAAALVLAPPIEHYRFTLEHNVTPLAVLCGDADGLTPRDSFERWSAAWRALVSVVWLEHAGHDLAAAGVAFGAAVDSSIAALESALAPSPSAQPKPG